LVFTPIASKKLRELWRGHLHTSAVFFIWFGFQAIIPRCFNFLSGVRGPRRCSCIGFTWQGVASV